MRLHRRLVAVMALMLVAGLIVANIATYESVRSFLYGRADETLDSSETLAFTFLGFAGQKHLSVTSSELDRRVNPDVYVLLLDPHGGVIARRPSGSPTRPDPEPLFSRTVPVEQVPAGTYRHFGRHAGTFRPDPNSVIVGSHGDPNGQYRVVAVTVPQGILVTGLSLNPTNDTLASLRRIELLASLGVVLVMGALALWVVRRGLRPLRDMATTADAIASGDLTRRVPEEPVSTEVGRLGVALNQMLTQIEGAFAEKSASEERLRQFVADASHELRTPLTSIRGYTELLRRGGFSDEAGTSRALLRVENEAIRMGGLVEDLLLLAELDRGRPLRAEPVDLHRICADVVDDHNAVEHAHELTLRPGGPVLVSGDPERLAQVAHNLVGNALAHTPPGTAIEVSTKVEGVTGVLRVSDNGPGIRSADVARVFDRFYRGDPSRAGAGTGLGLSMVRAIAEALGGTAEMAAAEGGGVTVVVTLPLGLTAPMAAPPAPLSVSAGAPNLPAQATRGPSST
ncbi:MAG TPA: HAMP domain-containing sensor histidine kinase [Acidimicrobiales bacterium]|nr:HAMP domain-containing sensor histidine kinase [Acidimicrobiales bacterium]